jgi:hypothetical protein
MKLQDILHADAEYTRNSGVDVDIVSNYGTVTITDTTGENESIFLQGDDADAFISEVEQLWNETGDMDRDTIACALAKPYIECIWNWYTMKIALWLLSFLFLIGAALAGIGASIGLLAPSWIAACMLCIAGCATSAEYADRIGETLKR